MAPLMTMGTAFSTQVVGNVYMACYNEAVSLQTAKDLTETLPEVRARVGVPLVFLVLVKDGTAPPSTEARDYILASTKKMLESCDSIHNLHEGSSIGSTAYRTLIRSMITVGGFRGKVFVHDSVETFANQLDAALRQDVIATARNLIGRA